MVAARKRENQNRINDKLHLDLDTVKKILQYVPIFVNLLYPIIIIMLLLTLFMNSKNLCPSVTLHSSCLVMHNVHVRGRLSFCNVFLAHR